jgi:hypothetical protein
VASLTATVLPSGSWLAHAFVRAGVYRWVHRIPVALVIVGVGLVLVLALLRGGARRLHRGGPGGYPSYLRSPGWARRRGRALRRARGRCEVCGSRVRVNVHHKTYERLGHEAAGDLQVLCRRHHAETHGVPV